MAETNIGQIICLDDKYRARASNKYGFLSIVSRFLSLIIFMSVINIKILATIGSRVIIFLRKTPRWAKETLTLDNNLYQVMLRWILLCQF